MTTTFESDLNMDRTECQFPGYIANHGLLQQQLSMWRRDTDFPFPPWISSECLSLYLSLFHSSFASVFGENHITSTLEFGESNHGLPSPMSRFESTLRVAQVQGILCSLKSLRVCQSKNSFTLDVWLHKIDWSMKFLVNNNHSSQAIYLNETPFVLLCSSWVASSSNEAKCHILSWSFEAQNQTWSINYFCFKGHRSHPWTRWSRSTVVCSLDRSGERDFAQ